MRRRQFITLLGGAATAWPLATGAQQGERVRRVGVLSAVAEDEEGQKRSAALRNRLNELGWTEGRNIRLDYRWGSGSVDRTLLFAQELVRLNPDVILASTTPATAALQQETRSIPIVFTNVSDPIGSGLVASLASPGGNITGFVNLESSLSGKWLNLLREIAPQVTRAALMFNPQTAPYASYYLDTFQSAARALALDAIETPVHGAAEFEAAMTMLGSQAGAGLVIMPDTTTSLHRDKIRSRRPLSVADDLPVSQLRRPRRFDLLWHRPDRPVSAGGGLCRPHTARCETRRASSSATDQV